MFERLGNFVSRAWPAILAFWMALFLALWAAAPNWLDVVDEGEFSFLPRTTPSRQAEDLFTKTFSSDLQGSSLVVIAHRDTSEGLRDDDKTYIDEVLVPRLKRLVELAPREEAKEDSHQADGGPVPALKEGNPNGTEPTKRDSKVDPKADVDADIRAGDPGGYFRPIVSRIRTFTDADFGPLLISEDNHATLIILELTIDFTDLWSEPTILRVERLIGSLGEAGKLQREKDYPAGLQLYLSGSAIVGRDMRNAGTQSARATERATFVLVILLLFAIYRAPIVAVIPLATVYLSVKIALWTLSLLAKAHLIRLFSGIEVYVTVVLYGAGVDYCMFLMSRYKEERDHGASFSEAISISVSRVGHALAASAGTVMCGIGMMVFTRFGKFQEAGVAMSFSLVIVLAAALTLTPALLRLAGRWGFWPRGPSPQVLEAYQRISPSNRIAQLLEREWFGRFWDRIGQALLARPGRIWIASVLLMVPFAILAVRWQDKLSYGVLSELPATDASVVGAAALRAHFPAGFTGPVTILIANPKADFRVDTESSNDDRPGWEQIQAFADNLYEKREKLGIVDIRSIASPLGMTDRVQTNPFRRRVMRKRAQSEYVSNKPGFVGQVTWIDVVLDNDPFSSDSIARFDRLKEAAPACLPAELKTAGTELKFMGPTASVRDLKTITAGDQVRIDFLVPGVVFLILVLLLRRIATSAYLIATVLFSYYVALGLTFAVFYLVHPGGFVGLDWKVPMFLFTILVAVGEDYNILLMARIEEEQRTHGPVEGIIVGLRKTGSIISSCGIIMAGTFSSLLFGSLQGLAQLGFALAVGVLLDTFVVRPIVVPAYLILLQQGRFGALGRFLGADSPRKEKKTPAVVDVEGG
jgi:putative drug exporter of the RND superfamily